MTSQTQAIALHLAPLADELGDLEQELEPFKAKIKRAEALRAAIRAGYRDSSALGRYQVHGERWSVLVGPCGQESVIDKAALLMKLGAVEFMRVASVSLKALQAACSADVVASVVSQSISGTRSLTVTPGTPRTAAAAAKRKATGKKAE